MIAKMNMFRTLIVTTGLVMLSTPVLSQTTVSGVASAPDTVLAGCDYFKLGPDNAGQGGTGDALYAIKPGPVNYASALEKLSLSYTLGRTLVVTYAAGTGCSKSTNHVTEIGFQ